MENMGNELSHFLNYLYENKYLFLYIICVFFTYNVRIEIHLYNTFLFLK
jgi:sugar phosphate permease